MSEQFDSDGIPKWAHDQFGGGMDRQIQKAASENQAAAGAYQRRIEALRAAATIGAASPSMDQPQIIDLAKAFERYLESGE